MTSASSYVSRLLETDAASLDSYTALLGQTTGATTNEYLRWLYADNPAGSAVGFNAFAGDELAGHYATIPVDGILDGAPARGLLSLNTATHPTHQGKGLFTKLAEQTYAHAREHGFDFVVGVANANSTPGFIRKLGFQLVTPLDVLVGVGQVTPSRGDGPAFALSWTKSALRWRLGRPKAHYFAVERGDESVIYAATHKLGILAYLAHAPTSIAPTLPRVPRARPLRMWIGIDPQLQHSGVLARLPDRLKPSPLNLIFRDLTGKGRTLSRDSARFSLLDFDAY